jgi:hypothetical protein
MSEQEQVVNPEEQAQPNLTDETSAPTEEQYRNSVEQWAETLGISVEFTGEFTVTCHDDAIAKLKAQMKRRSEDGEVQPHETCTAGGTDRVPEESGPAGS